MLSSSLHVMETYDLTHETRLTKQARLVLRHGLAERVVIAGRWEPGKPRIERIENSIDFVRIPMLRGSSYRILEPLRRWDAGRRLFNLAREIRPHLIDCHNLSALGWCVRVRRLLGSPLVYVPHELETERNGLSGLRKSAEKRAERRLISHCDAVVVVSDSIADWYAHEYRMKRPIVVRNVPEIKGEKPEPNLRLWRDKFLIPDSHLVFIYQGGLFRGRRIEQLLRVFARAKADRHIVFMGYGELRGEVEAAAKSRSNVHFAPPVKMDQVLQHTAGADVGLVGVANVCLSYFYSLPNKLFEFLMAGIPSLMPEYPEMALVAKGSGCGWVVGEKDEEWVAAINALSPEDVAHGKRAARAASANFTWGSEAEKLLTTYRRLMGPASLADKGL